MAEITQEVIQRIVDSSVPEELSLEKMQPITDDHASHILQLIQMGQTCLAADHVLFPEINGALSKTVGGVIQRLNILFTQSRLKKEEPKTSLSKAVNLRQYAYEALLEMALNFYGLESRWLIEDEKSECLEYILNVLDEWENVERKEGGISVGEAVIRKWLSTMKRVQRGHSMAAETARRIEESLSVQKNLSIHFLRKAETEIKGNIYYRIVKEGKCKFGNDYALGLRWLRHLGFEQVSTNPVLAARAYQDEPGLIERFREEAQKHPSFKQWISRPSQYGEEIALFATLLALWDNLYVFRPIFFNLGETSGGGVVSFQLNPNIAHLVEESIRDVFRAFSLASEKLSAYDAYLLAGYRIQENRGRPNMVIKVAATTPAARHITRTINAFGFGSNITVDFSLSQEATLILEEMDGMARAVRKGIHPTQLYMTNMGGRLESHLREVKLEELFQELRRKIGEERAVQKIAALSEANGTKEWVSRAKTYEEKVRAVTRFAHGQRRIDQPIFEALKEVASKEPLQTWEEAISKSGTLVARRVWSIFFSWENRERWVAYLMKNYNLTHDQAKLIMGRIHYLPASKRKPLDTYWTLSSRNLVHTEFPDHQENVRKMAEGPQFDLKEYEESISHTFPSGTLEQLNQIDDFRRAFEINSELAEIFKGVGILDDLGSMGLDPEDWPSFGPVQKTISEFRSAYDAFQKEMVSALRKPLKKKKSRSVMKR
ncbi:MAG: hypothetical protein HXY46_05705 [Syntrophaceae bacterium]|nr:hypothetical protein [Syntrophaceae bacterium]